jgi:alkylhydroperoxidase family enzyme
VPNVFKTLAHSPATMEAVADLGAHVRFGSSLDPTLRELVILSVASDMRCDYEWTHHWHIATRQQLDVEILRALVDGRGGELPSPLGTAVRIAHGVVTAAGADAADVDEFRTSLGSGAVIDLLVLIGYYRLLAGTINSVGGVELEPTHPTIPFTGDLG